MKQCSSCLRFLSNSHYHLRGDRTGLASQCKDCVRAAHYGPRSPWAIAPAVFNPLTQAIQQWRMQ